MQHVSLPRVGALQAIIDIVGPTQISENKSPGEKSAPLDISANNNAVAAIASAFSSARQGKCQDFYIGLVILTH